MKNLNFTRINIRKCGGIFDKNSIQDSISNLQAKTISIDFWDDAKFAQTTLKEISILENELKVWADLEEHYNEVCRIGGIE